MRSFHITDKNESTSVEIVFETRKGAENRTVKLIFDRVIEYGFYYSKEYVFYNVESLKLLVTKDGAFYISLDPDEALSECSDKDQDFVKANYLILVLEPQETKET